MLKGGLQRGISVAKIIITTDNDLSIWRLSVVIIEKGCNFFNWLIIRERRVLAIADRQKAPKKEMPHLELLISQPAYWFDPIKAEKREG